MTINVYFETITYVIIQILYIFEILNHDELHIKMIHIRIYPIL
jgi:hypothetical protein